MKITEVISKLNKSKKTFEVMQLSNSVVIRISNNKVKKKSNVIRKTFVYEGGNLVEVKFDYSNK